MDINQFVQLSLGSWSSQRSVHHLAFRHFEQVTSIINIITLECSDPEVIDLCRSQGIDYTYVVNPFRMIWEGETDWDPDSKFFSGSTILVPLPEIGNSRAGKLLRDQGYAETIPSIGEYHITEDGIFVLITEYNHAMAEEKIWFINPNFRLRVSLIRTSRGSGVVTASFSSETRVLDSTS